MGKNEENFLKFGVYVGITLKIEFCLLFVYFLEVAEIVERLLQHK